MRPKSEIFSGFRGAWGYIGEPKEQFSKLKKLRSTKISQTKTPYHSKAQIPKKKTWNTPSATQETPLSSNRLKSQRSGN
jgi:hypothetical protein